MDVISTTVNYKGIPIKVENNRIFTRSFGTTIYNKSMHWSWFEIKKEDLKPELKNYLKENKLIS